MLSQGRLGMHRYAVDTFLILCYPKSFQYTAVLQKKMRKGGGRQCCVDNKLKMLFNASCHAVSACNFFFILSE